MSRISHILIATDLTDRSEHALSRALQLCRDTRADQLSVLHVVSQGLPAELVSQQTRAAEAFLAARLGDVARPSGSAVPRVLVCSGVAFSTIIGKAIAGSADLTVIGAPGRHRYPNAFMGSTAELVIRMSNRPVLMVKQAVREPYRHVLAAFDGSEGALRALQVAIAVAPNAEVRVVHAWWPPQLPPGEIEVASQAIEQENNRLKALIREAAQHAIETSSERSEGLNIDMIEGNPYVVTKNACSWADLLVMGTHSKGRLASTASLGRLAQHMLVEATCDVLASRP